MIADDKPRMRVPARNMVHAGVTPGEMSAFATGVASWVVGGQYEGARTQKTSLKSWLPHAGSADTDSIGDLIGLRSRSRDLIRNDGIARGARNTTKVNVVGTGLHLRSEVNRDILGLSDDAAEAWEDKVEDLFDMWASSKFSDVTRTQNFYELQALALTSAFESGDVFALRRYKESPDAFLALCLQMVEADRVSTPIDKTVFANIDTNQGEPPVIDVRDGVQVDRDMNPMGYWLRRRHPGEDLLNANLSSQVFDFVPANGGSGQALVLHLFDRDRIGLSRGIPALAAVIEDLKQLSRYSEAELMAAVVSAFFTVFIKNDQGAPNDIIGEGMPNGMPLPPGQVALGSGSVVELGTGESIETANPNRPNANFEKFFLAMLRKVGISLGIPYEVLISHFTASYSASRAALETAWQFFTERRTWLSRNFCQPVYQWFLYECVARGLVDAPGFLDDPIKRAAWSGSCWVGPAQIVLDPVKEAEGADAWINMGAKTLDEVTLGLTGKDWRANQKQRGRERTERIAENLEPLEPPGTESDSGRPLQAPAAGGAATPAKKAATKALAREIATALKEFSE